MIDRNDDLRMMTTFMGWPLYPYLPVKNTKEREDGWPKLGCMFYNGKTVEPIIYDFSIDNIPKKKEDVKILNKFSSFDELLNAGWIVD